MNPLSVAPMMDRTDRHFRRFLRVLTRDTLLYTEMVTTGALLHGDRERVLRYSSAEHPVSLQLGGDDPRALAECARIAEEAGYDEVNLNVGCPSDRVQNGSFGACLMKTPEKVAEAVAFMMKGVRIPVTVKHRIGVDDLDRYEDMAHFVSIVSEAGCSRFSVHARKAWLQGLSPKENRTVPPLRYDDVYRLKEAFPDLFVEINGGICSLSEARRHLERVDAVMIGRAAYDNPWIFAAADREIYGTSGHSLDSRSAAIENYLPYVEGELARGTRLHSMTRHLHHLFHGVRGSKQWKQGLVALGRREAANGEDLLALARQIDDFV